MSSTTQKIAKDILRLREESSYKKFKENFFVNVPKLSGYLFNFKNLKDPKIYLIVNINKKFSYPKEYVKIGNFHFIIYNSDSIQSFLTCIVSNLSEILKIIKKLSKDDAESAEQKQGGLPYGYYEDKNGDIQVDTKQASEVREIFKVYSNVRSIKKVAQELDTNFSHIRDVLWDDRYAKMKKVIVPQLDLKRVGEILQANRKTHSTFVNHNKTVK